MPRTRAELKAEMEARAAELIDEVLDWNDQAQAPNLTEIEDQVLRFRKLLGERLAQVLAENQTATQPAGVLCPKCQRPMHRKRKRQARQVETRVGQVALRRSYYYCEHCREGFSPPGSTTGGGERVVE